MTATRLARRLGLDGNPLRRRTDRVAACFAALLLAMFLIGAPVLSIAAIGWAGRTGATGQQAARSWHQVSAVLRQAAPAPSFSRELLGSSRVQAWWTAPDGRAQAGAIPVSAGLAAGHTVPLWVDEAGSPTGPPPSHRAVLAREAAAGVVATVALGIALLCLASAGQWVLDRRRLAALGSGMGRCWPPVDQALPVPGLTCRPFHRLAKHHCRTGAQLEALRNYGNRGTRARS